MRVFNHVLFLSNGYVHQVRIEAKSEAFAKVLRVKVKKQIEKMLLSSKVGIAVDFLLEVSSNVNPSWTYSTTSKGELI